MGQIKTKVLHRLVWAAAALVGGAMPALAADATPWVRTPQTQVRLIAGEQGAGGDGAVTLGLHFRLKEGWKIYWRRPGDAGFPPRLDWSESDNLKETEFSWPAPVRFQVLGFQTMGYTDEVVFPITAQLVDPKRPLEARIRLDYLTCDDICIPYSATLEMAVPPDRSGPTEHASLIRRFSERVPGDGSAHGLTIESIETAGGFTPIDEMARSGAVRVMAISIIPFVRPDVFIEGPDLAFFGVPSARYSDAGRRAVITVPVTLEGDAAIENERVRVTLTDGARSAERELVATTGAALLPPAVAATPFWIILAFAVIGGAILNLMPCVLPVLSLKIVSFASLGGAAPQRVRTSFLATAAGIVASFLAIAVALAGLKVAGAAVGWGIQFQYPWFIAALAVLATLFACNLWGLFEVPLPGWLGGFAARPAETPARSTLAGDFATGALATVLATPCSAPFLGTAVGFALAGAPHQIVAVFAALGIGMALPYLACAAFPAFARVLPRPGAWMIVLKRVLAVALAGTAAWLLTVLAAQQSATSALVIGGVVVATAIVLVLHRYKPALGPRATAGAVAALAMSAIALPTLLPAPAPTMDQRRVARAASDQWRPFDPDAIPGLVREGKIVFIDITADWCITCQVNKVAVLDRPPVDALLQDPRVVAMQGDWTRPDPVIAAYLQSFGRYAIPFNAVYGPGRPDGIALSELLTAGSVLDALASASNGVLAASK